MGPCESQVIPSSSLRDWPRPPPWGRGPQRVGLPAQPRAAPLVPFSTVLGTLPSPALTHSPHKGVQRVVPEERPLHAQQQGPSAGLQLLLMEAVGDEGDAQLAQGLPHRVVTMQAAPASSGAQVQEQQKG